MRFALLVLCVLLSPPILVAQDISCDSLRMVVRATESHCTATGSIHMEPAGGSGNYKYKISGVLNSNYTSSHEINGLPPGVYTVHLYDNVSRCEISTDSVIVGGTYEDPRFLLHSKAVACDNGTNGSVEVFSLSHGRAPFTFQMLDEQNAVLEANPSGTFENLPAGDYKIRLQDSCGGIQTRVVAVENYSWSIAEYKLEKTACDSAFGYVHVLDNRGLNSRDTLIDGFTFGLVTQTDTLWQQSPYFAVEANGNFTAQLLARDTCGNIKGKSVHLTYTPSVGTAISYSRLCNSYAAAITGASNLTNPTFSLYQDDQLIESKDSELFESLAYNTNYCIQVTDGCYDTTIVRCFTQAPPQISVANDVKISNYACSTFTAAVHSVKNLTNPIYILLGEENQFLELNTTGKFQTGYGKYSILIRDGCQDTSITRSFSVAKPRPALNPVLTPSYVTCDYFGIHVGGSNLFAPQYCLTDSLGTSRCNSTGRFDTIPLGKYTVSVRDGCTDSTIIRFLEVDTPILKNDVAVSITGKACSTFSVSLSTKNFANGQYCLFGADGALVDCNGTGKFAALPYGNYYVMSRAVCPDTIVRTNILGRPEVPSLGTSVNIFGKTCATFSASVTGQKNLTQPSYQLINNKGVVVESNSSGLFPNIPYGEYQIRMRNQCYDTTIVRSLSAAANPFSFGATTRMSCTYGATRVQANFAGNFPVTLKIWAPDGQLVHEKSYTSTSVSVDQLAVTDTLGLFKLLAVDACGNEAVQFVKPVIAWFEHSFEVENKCPGSQWANGYGNITAKVITNAGARVVRIVQKDGRTVNLAPQIIRNDEFTFTNLGPAVYVLRYYANDGCANDFYDTATIHPYAYPGLSKSAAYKCDENGYTVSAVVSNGVAPFQYSLIGSYPSSPSVVSAPQSEPVFTINNGNDYSLVRLRAMDACGNATLGDASILPPAQNYVTTTANCFGHAATLSIDQLNNTQVSWFRKDSARATDSTYLGSGFSYTIPEVTPADTGLYFAVTNLNNGCLQRTYSRIINGDCFAALPLTLLGFYGTSSGAQVLLNWRLIAADGLHTVVVEKKTNGQFFFLGQVNARPDKAPSKYEFADGSPAAANFYRLKFLYADGSFTYSNVIHVRHTSLNKIDIYPNPVETEIIIDFNQYSNRTFRIRLVNALSQNLAEVVREKDVRMVRIKRTPDMKPGFYYLYLYDLDTGERHTQKLIFK